MRVRFGRQAVLGIMLICQLSLCIATEIPDTNNTSKYLDGVHTFADNLLKPISWTQSNGDLKNGRASKKNEIQQIHF